MKTSKIFLIPALALSLVLPGASLAADSTTPITTDKALATVTSEKPKTERPNQMISREKRAQHKEVFGKIREENKEQLEKMKTLREEAKTIVAATKFDKESFLKKHAEMDALRNQMKQKTTVALAELLEKMTPDERKAYASRPLRRGNRQEGRGPRAAWQKGSMGQPLAIEKEGNIPSVK